MQHIKHYIEQKTNPSSQAYPNFQASSNCIMAFGLELSRDAFFFFISKETR